MSGFSSNSDTETRMISFDGAAGCTGTVCLELVVQGKPLHYHGSGDVRSLLESQGEKSAYANVRINGSVLRRRDFENIPLKDGDNVDFLYYMGGGNCLI